MKLKLKGFGGLHRPIKKDQLQFALYDVIELCRRELGSDYHISVLMIDSRNPKWYLFKHYDNFNKYFDEANKVILSSTKGNTIEDLVEFTLNERKMKLNESTQDKI